MSAEEQKSFVDWLSNTRLELLVLAKKISDGADRKEQLQAIVELLDNTSKIQDQLKGLGES
jgi:hypothetical protein